MFDSRKASDCREGVGHLPREPGELEVSAVKHDPARRPIQARNTRWAAAAARAMAALGATPNQISLASVGFAAAAAHLVLKPHHAGLDLFLAAVCIQLRLLCNLLDGMVAVEGGKGSRSGEIWNDLPDRISDALILAAVGHALPYAWGAELGWAAALGAVLTAYVRVLAGASGAKQRFVGPMAKQQRMAAITVALLLSILEGAVGSFGKCLAVALVVIVAGCAATAWRRTRLAVAELEAA